MEMGKGHGQKYCVIPVKFFASLIHEVTPAAPIRWQKQLYSSGPFSKDAANRNP